MAGKSTKVRIMDALKELMESTPLERISVTDVASQAGISRQTFYYHFDSIYGIFDWFMEKNNPHPERTVPIGRVPSPAACALEICSFFRKNKFFVLEFRRVYHEDFRAHMEDYFMHLFSDLMVHVFPETADRADLDKLTTFLAVGYTGFVEKWFDQEMSFDLKEMFTGLFNSLHAGAPEDILGKVVDNLPSTLWKPASALKDL